MSLNYETTNWENGKTVLKAEHLRKIEKGITDIISENDAIYKDEDTRKSNEKQRQEEHSRKMNEASEVVSNIQKDYDSLQKIIIDENASANLQKQINSVNSQLEHKANLNSIFSMANMGQDVKEAMTGGSVAVVGTNSVALPNLHESLASGLCEYSDVDVEFRDGYYNKTLEFVEFSSWMCSTFNVSPGERFKISGHNTNTTLNFVSIVNESNSIIYSIAGGQSYTNFVFIVPSDGCKIYINHEKSVKFELKKAKALNVSDNIELLKNNLTNLGKSVDCIIDGSGDITKELTWELGGINGHTGIEANADYCIRNTDYLIGDGRNISFEFNNGFEVCIITYNMDGTYKSFYVYKSSFTLETNVNKKYKITFRKSDDTTPISDIAVFLLNISIFEDLDITNSNKFIKNSLSSISEMVTSLQADLDTSYLIESDLYSESMDFEFRNNTIISGAKKEGITNSHLFVYFKKNMNTIMFEHSREDDWIALGGDMLNTTAIAIGNPWSIRLIDLGLKNGSAVDISIEDKANVGDIILFTWENDTLISKKDTHDGNGLVDWFEVDLSRYPTLQKYKIEKRFGAISNTQAGGETLIKNVRYSSKEELSMLDRIIKLENMYLNGASVLKGKTWNAVGDSITQHNRYQPYVAERTGVVPTSMKGLASSTMAVNNSYLVNKSVVERVCGLNGNDAYENADIWTIFAGVNDWLYGTPIGSIDSKDNTTFYGALREVCENILLRENKPKLILFTPLQSNRNGTSSHGIKMAEYRKAIIEVGEYYSVPVLDLYSIGGLNPINLNVYAPDGIHPNDEGTNIYAPKIVHEMERLY